MVHDLLEWDDMKTWDTDIKTLSVKAARRRDHSAGVNNRLDQQEAAEPPRRESRTNNRRNPTHARLHAANIRLRKADKHPAAFRKAVDCENYSSPLKH